jgi:hypothetical protein
MRPVDRRKADDARKSSISSVGPGCRRKVLGPLRGLAIWVAGRVSKSGQRALTKTDGPERV